VFAAGMSMMDAADGILMCRAYGWAFENAWKKVLYNLVMTAISVAVALVVGTIELASVVADWSISLDFAGYGIVAVFLTSWAISVTAKSFANN
jgi:high-affinity nickel-transport protein